MARRDPLEPARREIGRDAQDLYTPADLEGIDLGADVGFPGDAPFTRGVQANMYRGRLWTMRQYAGFGSAKATNERFRLLLERGQTGLSVAFDLPTQMGRDSDHPMALGEVGKVGVAIDSLEDMATLFDGIPLDKVTTSMTINAPASVLLMLYELVAERQGVASDQLSGTIQNDILKEYAARASAGRPSATSNRARSPNRSLRARSLSAARIASSTSASIASALRASSSVVPGSFAR